MHTIERLIDGTRTPTKNISDIIDFREHVSMSLHVGFLSGSTAVLYGSILEPSYNAWQAVSLHGSTTINTDGVYIVPPQYRYYKLHLNRAGGATPTILFYGIKHGAFLVRLADDVSISDGEFDKLRKGTQGDIAVSFSLTNTPITLGSFSFLGPQNIYILSSSFSLLGTGGAVVKVNKTVNSVTTTLFQYTLTGEQPTVIEQIPFLYKVDHQGLPCTLTVEANKLIHNWSSELSGKLTYIVN